MTPLDLNNLGFKKAPQETRVVVAMSGGVDSSVTAALMVEAGFDVVGITLQLYDHGMALQKKGACCAGQDIYDAAQVAEKLNFPHYVLDYESIFKQSVIDGFADGYLRGETPIPCIQCNQKVKFKDLLKASKDLNAEALITGHYVQRVKGPNGAELHRSNDKSKDQSYFLFATRQDELDYLRFPLGHMDKAETRRHGQRFDLNVADKPDSQDICFVPNGSYAQVVQKLRPGAIEPGPIVHVDGTILGQHKGIIHYTIGQRRGLALGDHNSGDPLYVIRLDPKKHRVIVGPKEALAQKEFAVHDINWLSEKMNDPISCQVKVRSTHNPIEASVHVDFQTLSGKVTLTENTYGIAPGQACVFYDGDRVLGGGWITREEICD